MGHHWLQVYIVLTGGQFVHMEVADMSHREFYFTFVYLSMVLANRTQTWKDLRSSFKSDAGEENASVEVVDGVNRHG